MPAYPLIDQALRNQFVREGQKRELQKRIDPWEPGQRGRAAVNDWMLQNVAMPMYEKGYPQVGAYLTGIANTATDLALPETNEDAAALPFGAFKKGGKLMSNAVDMLTPEARQQALKRQNAIQAVREAIQKKPEDALLGKGVDVGVYDAEGVVVKSPALHPDLKDFYSESKRSAIDKAVIDRQKKDTEKYFTNRFVTDLGLEYSDLAPEQLMVKTKKAPYLVQEKANSILFNDLQSKNVSYNQADEIVEDLTNRIREDSDFIPDDLHSNNIGNFGTVDEPDYKVIDSGEFTGYDPQESMEDAPSYWQFIDWLKSKK